MEWKTYEERFLLEATNKRLSEEYKKKHLNYAYVLFQKSLPIIYDQLHLSYLLGYDIKYLRKISNSQNPFYRTFKIKKKNNSYRNISEPLPTLKDIQRWILNEILYKCPTSPFAKAYKKKVSLKDNVKFHRGQKIILTLDIKDFFGTIQYNEVFHFFGSLGYRKEVAVLLTNLCTLNGSLPQGGITSPALSNLIMLSLDKRIAAYCRKNKIRYTRYADDMNFSGDFQPGEVIRFVAMVLESKGFVLNHKKTRTRLPHQRQEVTGIVVNEKIQVDIQKRKMLRQSIYYIKKYGIDSHCRRMKRDKLIHLKELLGLANFICFVNPKDEQSANYLQYLRDLWNYERQKFK